MLGGCLGDFLLPLLKVLVGGFGFALRLTGQIGVARQRLPHPHCNELRVERFGDYRGALQGHFSAL